MERTSFSAGTASGQLGGWVTGDGPPVLVLHGGPGLGYLAFHAIEELGAKEADGGLSLDEEVEQLRLLWPSYFTEPATAPEMPPIRMASGSNAGLWGDIVARAPELEAALPSIAVPVGVLAGEGSPMPTTSGTDTADRIPGGWAYVVPGAGHFVWIESPGSVLAGLDRLTGLG